MPKRKPSYIAFRQKLLDTVLIPTDPESEEEVAEALRQSAPARDSVRKWHG